uniref:TPR_REGION domain-containing protein n=1 Tax=Angiostrongylus cantonensis TaxID=6313 RepID=A0A0K0D6U9_ANGCA
MCIPSPPTMRNEVECIGDLSRADERRELYPLLFDNHYILIGIKQKCLDRKLNSILYSNRAAAEKYIGNLRCAIKDSAMALRFNPMNLKAAKRGAECLLELGHANDCVDWIELAVRNFASGKEIYEEGVWGYCISIVILDNR